MNFMKHCSRLLKGEYLNFKRMHEVYSFDGIVKTPLCSHFIDISFVFIQLKKELLIGTYILHSESSMNGSKLLRHPNFTKVMRSMYGSTGCQFFILSQTRRKLQLF